MPVQRTFTLMIGQEGITSSADRAGQTVVIDLFLPQQDHIMT